jgi:hypothetical protein
MGKKSILQLNRFEGMSGRGHVQANVVAEGKENLIFFDQLLAFLFFQPFQKKFTSEGRLSLPHFLSFGPIRQQHKKISVRLQVLAKSPSLFRKHLKPSGMPVKNWSTSSTGCCNANFVMMPPILIVCRANCVIRPLQNLRSCVLVVIERPASLLA